MSGATILIADDEPNQLELLSYNLTNAGFDVNQSGIGRAAIAVMTYAARVHTRLQGAGAAGPCPATHGARSVPPKAWYQNFIGSCRAIHEYTVVL